MIFRIKNGIVNVRISNKDTIINGIKLLFNFLSLLEKGNEPPRLRGFSKSQLRKILFNQGKGLL